MPLGPSTRIKGKKIQETLNGLEKEFIWANPAFKETLKSNQALKNGIQQGCCISIIIVVDGDDQHNFGNYKPKNKFQ